MPITLPAFSKTPAFADSEKAATVDRLNAGQGCAVALVEGAKSFEKLSLYPSASTVTGAQNNYNLDGLAAAPAIGTGVLNWAGAADVTFTGFAGGIAGRVVLIKNKSASSRLRIATQHTDSSEANRCINPSAFSQDLGVGGSALLVYDGVASRWNVELISAGAPITVAFSAGDFTASGSMSWTVGAGDVTTFTYVQVGKMLHIHFYIVSTTVGGTPSTELRITIPGGYTSAKVALNTIQAGDNGSVGVGAVLVAASGTVLRCFKSMTSADNWSAATDATFVAGQVTIEIT